MISAKQPIIARFASLDRFFWLAMLIAAAVVIPRSILITQAHSPTMDEQIDLRIGLSNLLGNPSGMINAATDAPLGQEISALPMLLVGCNPAKPMNPATSPPHLLMSDDPTLVSTARPPPALVARLRAARRDVFFGNALPPDTLRLLIAIWKALLFVPAAGLVFHWCRWLYGFSSAWLALLLLLIDPTFAGHIPLATLDVLGVEGVLFACYFAWRWMEQPGSQRLLLVTALFSAAALLLKLTTIILPFVIVLIAIAHWIKRDKLNREMFRRRFDGLLVLAILSTIFLWALTGFDIAVPAQWIAMPHAIGHFSIYPALEHAWPAGHFIQVLVSGFNINASHRWAYLLGQAKRGGWWYYFPVVAFYKVPLGFFLVFLLAIASFIRQRFRFEEWSLLLPMLAWMVMLMFFTNINTGFRHFLPAYVFMLMLASRAVWGTEIWVRSIAWLAVAIALVDTLIWHPDYLSYFNRPISAPWLVCNDSNIDWGQGLKQTRSWLDQRPTANRPVYVRYDWDPVWVDYYLQGRAKRLTQFETPPKNGILIICPVWVAGYWDPGDAYGFLRSYQPTAIIGHSMLVYDLDHLSKAPRMRP